MQISWSISMIYMFKCASSSTDHLQFCGYQQTLLVDDTWRSLLRSISSCFTESARSQEIVRIEQSNSRLGIWPKHIDRKQSNAYLVWRYRDGLNIFSYKRLEQSKLSELTRSYVRANMLCLLNLLHAPHNSTIQSWKGSFTAWWFGYRGTLHNHLLLWRSMSLHPLHGKLIQFEFQEAMPCMRFSCEPEAA